MTLFFVRACVEPESLISRTVVRSRRTIITATTITNFTSGARTEPVSSTTCRFVACYFRDLKFVRKLTTLTDWLYRSNNAGMNLDQKMKSYQCFLLPCDSFCVFQKSWHLGYRNTKFLARGWYVGRFTTEKFYLRRRYGLGERAFNCIFCHCRKLIFRSTLENWKIGADDGKNPGEEDNSKVIFCCDTRVDSTLHTFKKIIGNHT